MVYGLVFKGGDKTPLVNFLEERGVETRDLLPLTNQPVYRKFFTDPTHYPIARSLNSSGFYIGCHPGMTMDDADYVVEQFRVFFRSH